VAAAVDHHEGSLRQIARRFRIGVSTLVRWLDRRHQTGSLDPKPHGGGRPQAVDARHAAVLRDLVRQQPDATLDELNARLGLGCSRMAIFRALLRWRISRKKKVLHAQDRDAPRTKRKRRDFRRRLAQVDPKALVFVDETGATTVSARSYQSRGLGPVSS
jgi:transposase